MCVQSAEKLIMPVAVLCCSDEMQCEKYIILARSECFNVTVMQPCTLDQYHRSVRSL